MALTTRVWSAGKLLVLGGALLATYLLFATAAMRLALKAREVQVPDLTNHTASEATATASDLGLTIKVDTGRRFESKVAADHVLAQHPPAGSIARSQRAIRVWLSGGQRAATVPALAGEIELIAEVRLSWDGRSIAAVSEIRSSDYPSDIVVAQDPPANAVAAGVALLVNRGQQAVNYVMPDLIGVNGDRAADLLRNHGFRVAIVGPTPYPGVAAGIVIRQSPQAGFQIAPGEPISIEVSR